MGWGLDSICHWVAFPGVIFANNKIVVFRQLIVFVMLNYIIVFVEAVLDVLALQILAGS